jgi:hypothetical protein
MVAWQGWQRKEAADFNSSHKLLGTLFLGLVLWEVGWCAEELHSSPGSASCTVLCRWSRDPVDLFPEALSSLQTPCHCRHLGI